MPLLLGTQDKLVQAEQGGEPCGFQGTSPCHCQAMEAEIWFGSLSSREVIIDCVRR